MNEFKKIVKNAINITNINEIYFNILIGYYAYIKYLFKVANNLIGSKKFIISYIKNRLK